MNTSLRRLLSIFIALALHNAHGSAEFIGAYKGVQRVEQTYIQGETESQAQTIGFQLNMQPYRRRPTGWLVRGAKIHLQQQNSLLQTDIHIPVYQFHIHQGIWFQFKQQENTFETRLNDAQVYLPNNGSAQGLTADTNVTFEHSYQQGQIYWYESVKDEGPINTLGFFYSVESSPVNASISTTNATVFDGQFSGFGMTLGRIKDDKGLNFQWRLNIAQLDSDFSNDATEHRSLSSAESTVYQVELNLNWHYRYYLTPYWYLVPSLHYQYRHSLQTQFNPEFVEHDGFSFTQLSGAIALRRYF